MKTRFYLITAILILSSLKNPCLCQNKDQGPITPNTPTQSQTNTNSNNYIFLNFHIQKTTANPSGEVVLTGYKILPGKVKSFLAPPESQGRKGQLLVTLKNPAGEVTSQTVINNPLEREIEYPAENGQIGNVTVSQTEADFSVRLPYSSGCNVSEIKVFGENQTLTRISSLTIANQ